jgi:hypothetical protein
MMTKIIVIISIFWLPMVSVDGIGPSTSVLSGQRSTTELHAHLFDYNKKPLKSKQKTLFRGFFVEKN